jgi:excisionase family DNA binding protein
MFREYPDVVGAADLRKMLGVGRNTVYFLLRENKIPSIRIGKIYRIPKVNIIKYLQSKD